MFPIEVPEVVIAVVGILMSLGGAWIGYSYWKRLRNGPSLTVKLRVKDRASRKLNRLL